MPQSEWVVESASARQQSGPHPHQASPPPSLGVRPAWGEEAVGYRDEYFPVEAAQDEATTHAQAPSPKSALCFLCSPISIKPVLGTQGFLDESWKFGLY